MVWADGDLSSSDIYGYNIATGEVFSICTDTGSQWAPAIDGSIVVWTTQTDPTANIDGYDLSSGEKFTVMEDTPADYRAYDNPAVSSGVVLWNTKKKGASTDWNI